MSAPRESVSLPEAVALGMLALAAVILVANLFLALTAPEPESNVISCTEADGACLTWDDIREAEWHSSTEKEQ